MSNGNTPSNWDQTVFEAQMNAEAKDRRAGRKAFQPDASANSDETSIDNYIMTKGRHLAGGGTKVLTKGNALLTMNLQASVHIDVSAKEDTDLRKQAAQQIGDALAFAEDAIVLLGSKAEPLLIGDKAVVPSKQSAVTLTLGSQLGDQIGLVNPDKLKAVSKGKVIDSAIAALNNLRSKGHHGPFVIIVSPDLNEEATKVTLQGVVVPPVNMILPELRQQDGWIWSDVLKERTGVALSLGGQTFDLKIIRDPYVVSAQLNHTFDIVAAIQFRLRINNSLAVEPLPQNPK